MHVFIAFEVSRVGLPAAANPEVSEWHPRDNLSDHIETACRASIATEAVSTTISILPMCNDAAASSMLAIQTTDCAELVVEGTKCAIATDVFGIWLPHQHGIDRTNWPTDAVQDAGDQSGS